MTEDNAAPSSTEPTGIIADIVEGMHNLEQKVEHLIHPEMEAPKVEAPGEALPSGTPVDSGTSLGSSGQVSTGSESTSGTEAGSATAGEPQSPAAGAAANLEVAPMTSTALNGVASPDLSSGPVAESPNVAPAAVDGVPEAGAAPVAGGEAGNVVAGGAEPASSDSAASAPTVSDPVAEFPRVTTPVGSQIREKLAAIRSHLHLAGFEQSSVAKIHAELEAIERLL